MKYPLFGIKLGFHSRFSSAYYYFPAPLIAELGYLLTSTRTLTFFNLMKQNRLCKLRPVFEKIKNILELRYMHHVLIAHGQGQIFILESFMVSESLNIGFLFVKVKCKNSSTQMRTESLCKNV